MDSLADCTAGAEVHDNSDWTGRAGHMTKMATDFSYDPVTAVDEASATGEVAAIFADIRRTMGIPLVTSIWRGLAGMGESLAAVWELARPIHASGLPVHALARLIARIDLPQPLPLTQSQLACVGIGRQDLRDIHTILAAYNRSNGLNFVALAALVTPPAAQVVASEIPAPPPAWPALRPLLARAQIDSTTWEMIREVNSFGAPGIDAGVATLWRHLAHWPGLLALIYSAFAPWQARGEITAASAKAVALAVNEGAGMAHLRPASFNISRQARDTIDGYVNVPTQVARMVVLGNALVRWLGEVSAPA